MNREIKSLGTPNIGAIEEFDRVNTRYTYLSEQRTDVEKAKEELTGVIDEITRQMTEIFGQQFKLLCGEDKNAAQLEFVIGSNGGGLSHDLWRENLKLACAVQETLYKDYPTLMRPVTVRNSRYNQHMTTGSLLVEVGTAGNSLEEAVNAARLFAAGFAKTIQNGT